jgi:hypothetical protein
LQLQCQQGEKQQMQEHPPQPQSQTVVELTPLLTSTSFWSNISSKTIEGICSRPPLPELVSLISQASPLRSNHEASTDNDEANNLEYSTTCPAAAKGGKRNPTQTIVWWTLPSALLCTISQMHFTIACEYIWYWIDQAVIGHEQLYSSSTTTRTEQLSSNNVGSSSNEAESLFHQAVQRIEQIRSTSTHLNLLCSHILHCMEEKESQTALEMSLLEEDDENAAFNSLAYKAIHHHAF